MQTERVTVEHRQRSARVTYDHQRRGNSFDESALLELVEALEGAAGHADVAVIELVMAGRNFCTGWDVSDFERLAGLPAEAVAESLRSNDSLLTRISELGIPVVAQVRGRVCGFGVGLLLSLHLPIAADDVRLSLPEVGFGICPGGVLHALLERLPRSAVDFLVLSGEEVGVAELLRWGMVASSAPSELLDRRVSELVASLLDHPAPITRTIVAAARTTAVAGSPEPAFLAAAQSILDRAHH